MTNRGRDYNLALYHSLYKELPLEDQRDRWMCFYCGQPGGSIDHQPPISVVGNFLTASRGFECVKVPCCQHCNSVLSDFSSETLSERFNELKNRLRAKYAKELRLEGQWTIEEIMELGPNLRGMVMGSVKLGRLAEERILYPGHKIKSMTELWNDGGMSRCRECGAIYLEESCPECGRPS